MTSFLHKHLTMHRADFIILGAIGYAELLFNTVIK